ncbi:MAG: PH domain-containing protein [Salinisphaera sp.]|nr:PH domain-containing protein [Salinisphaera sp.]
MELRHGHPQLHRDDVAARVPVECLALSLRVGQCVNIKRVTRDLLIAGGLIAIGPLLPRVIALLPVFPYQSMVVWGVYLVIVGLPITHAIYNILAVAAYRIEVSDQAVRVRRGVFTQRHDHLALFRYRDHWVWRPLLYRLFRRGDVWIDASDTRFCLPGVKRPVEVAETIHQLATRARLEHGVRVVE